MPPSLYIHIPFCRGGKCLYCDFVSVPYEAGQARAYVESLGAEMRLRGGTGPGSFYIGGGTPTVLEPEGLARLFRLIKENYGVRPDAEFTVEANPCALDMERLDTLLCGGANRISIGVQSFDRGELKTLGRPHTAGDAEAAVALARRAGFENLSLDLLYGVPGQTGRSLKNTLSKAIALSPEHISAYELTVEEGTPLSRAVKGGAGGALRMPGEDEILSFSRITADALRGAGYRRYEVSNYSRPGRESLHNINYWRRGEYIGLGAAAHSFLGNTRWKNTKDTGEYIRLLSEGKLPVEAQESLSQEDARREFLFLGLRLIDGISVREAGSVYGISLENEKVRDLVGEGGLFEFKDGFFRATAKGLPVLNAALAALLAALGL